MSRSERLEKRLGQPGVVIVPYLTGGFPDLGRFVELLTALAAEAPVIEVGIPFSDPMADGATVQESSRVALDRGATMMGILEAVEAVADLPAEVVMMSYLNPLLAHGLETTTERLASAGVAALVVPDLPFDESGDLAAALAEPGIGLVQMVTPVTAPDRLSRLGAVSQGFTYAVTMTGTTGGTLSGDESVGRYLDQVGESSRAPVVAGFGVRSRDQVMSVASHCDGVIVGSALVEVIAQGGDPVGLLRGMRP